jgi:hypothetical protein
MALSTPWRNAKLQSALVMNIGKWRVSKRTLGLGALFAAISAALVLCGFTTIGLVYFVATLPLAVSS